jgi:hypothetical protein
MTDRTRNPAQKRRGQETGETAANQERRMARERRRDAHERAAPDRPAEHGLAGKGKGRGKHRGSGAS